MSALSEPKGSKLKVLVEINRNIAAGLMTVPEETPEPDILNNTPPEPGGIVA